MKVREERVLADRKLAKSDGQVDALLGACWEETLEPGPYDFGDKDIDWGAVLQGDRFFALLQVRALREVAGEYFLLACHPHRELTKGEVSVTEAQPQRVWLRVHLELAELDFMHESSRLSVLLGRLSALPEVVVEARLADLMSETTRCSLSALGYFTYPFLAHTKCSFLAPVTWPAELVLGVRADSVETKRQTKRQPFIWPFIWRWVRTLKALHDRLSQLAWVAGS